MGGRCPRALDLKGPRETERKRRIGRKEKKKKGKKNEKKEKKKKEKEKERKTLVKYPDVDSIRYIP